MNGRDVSADLILGLLLFLVWVLYCVAAIISNRRHRQWPLYRTAFWTFGVMCAASVVIGPLAAQAHTDFRAHMLGHLLLGMLAPLLIALAAPMTLILRALNVKTARRLSRALKSRPVSILSNPMTASLLNIYGLWVLYLTDLYRMMQQDMFLYTVVHLHVFLAGYLFTSSFIYIDPTPHRLSFTFRAVVFVFALAGHGILSKYIYAHPPRGVPSDQAEAGGMLMYYGGDAIDIIMIFIFCFQWYRATWARASNFPAPDYR